MVQVKKATRTRDRRRRRALVRRPEEPIKPIGNLVVFWAIQGKNNRRAAMYVQAVGQNKLSPSHNLLVGDPAAEAVAAPVQASQIVVLPVQAVKFCGTGKDRGSSYIWPILTRSEHSRNGCSPPQPAYRKKLARPRK
jgi:hypothetical protein